MLNICEINSFSLVVVWNCTEEKGYCLNPDRVDIKKGVHKLHGNNVMTREQKDECIQLCMNYGGATGCEWKGNGSGKGCFVHTKPVGMGSGSGSITTYCVVASKCISVPENSKFMLFTSET